MYGYVGYEWGRHMMRWWVHSLLVLGEATRFLGSPIPCSGYCPQISRLRVRQRPKNPGSRVALLPGKF